jgi:predicted ArsR family transcriptional regulator
LDYLLSGEEEDMEREAMKNIAYDYSAWRQEDREFVLKHYGPMTASQIANKIGKSADAVRKFVARYDASRGAR